MGTCKYCGKSAGLFSSKHKECEDLHAKGLADLDSVLERYFRGSTDISNVRSSLMNLRRTSFIIKEDAIFCSEKAIEKYISSLSFPTTTQQLQHVVGYMTGVKLTYNDLNQHGTLTRLSQKLCRGYLTTYFQNGASIASINQGINTVMQSFPISSQDLSSACINVMEQAAQKFSQGGLISQQSEQMLQSYASAFGISLSNLPTQYSGSSLSKVSQSIILRNLQQGQLPQNNTGCPIVLGKGESLLWSYDGVTFFQEKIEKQYRGRRSGWSFRVMKGVTYHTGGTKLKPIEDRYMNNEGTGTLYVTNKNLIFQGNTSALKVSYNKLIGITPYSDGIEIHREGANVKRVMLQGFDSWFIMNVLQLVN